MAAAIRARDVSVVRRRNQSTVGRRLQILGDPPEQCTRLQRYLSLTELQRHRLICRAGVLLTAEQCGTMDRVKGARCTMLQCWGIMRWNGARTLTPSDGPCRLGWSRRWCALLVGVLQHVAWKETGVPHGRMVGTSSP